MKMMMRRTKSRGRQKPRKSGCFCSLSLSLLKLSRERKSHSGTLTPYFQCFWFCLSFFDYCRARNSLCVFAQNYTDRENQGPRTAWNRDSARAKSRGATDLDGDWVERRCTDGHASDLEEGLWCSQGYHQSWPCPR